MHKKTKIVHFRSFLWLGNLNVRKNTQAKKNLFVSQPRSQSISSFLPFFRIFTAWEGKKDPGTRLFIGQTRYNPGHFK